MKAQALTRQQSDYIDYVASGHVEDTEVSVTTTISGEVMLKLGQFTSLFFQPETAKTIGQHLVDASASIKDKAVTHG